MLCADYHMHTSFSPDGDNPPRKMLERACALGLTEAAVTDHLDITGRRVPAGTQAWLDRYTREITALKSVFAGRLTVRLGLELGPVPEHAEALRALLEGYPFDFLICSTHSVGGVGLYGGPFFAGKTKRESYGEYFDEVLRVVKACPPFCVYGHLDYIERYSNYPERTVRYGDHADVIDEILERLIADGKGLEVNASGYRYGFGHANPQPDILRRYKELGGEILTIGSDAHDAPNVASGFSETRDMLLALGFRYYTLYEGMKPFMTAL